MTPIDPSTLTAAAALERIAATGFVESALMADADARRIPLAVLDTNVVLDLWYWNDKDALALRSALQEKRIACACTFGTLVELADVIGRAQFALTVAQQEELLETYADMSLTVAEDYAPSSVRCLDRDDQKFLDLAQAVKADWLFTKDKLVTRAGRKLRAAGTRTLTPKEWAALESQKAGAT